MRIFQISDPHIGPAGEEAKGVDVRTQFTKVLEQMDKYKPDLLVLSGDLSYQKGDKEIYQWVRNQLHGSGIPFYAIPGNHDDSTLLAQIFHPDKPIHSDGKFFFSKKINEDIILFLDSGDGSLGDMQLNWIEELLERNPDERFLVFMHHPPVLGGVPHMDKKHAMMEMEAFQEVCRRSDKAIYCFTGHYHVQKYLSKENLKVFICPSTFFQIDESGENFQLEHTLPGFQVIDVLEKEINVQVHYLPGL